MNSQQDDITDYFKTKRDQYVVEIRKNKTTQTIAAKRLKLSKHIDNKENELIPNGNYSSQEITAMLGQVTGSFSSALKLGNYQEVARCVQHIRTIISRIEKVPLAEMIETGVVPDILGLIDPRLYQYEDLMVECCWTISNIASGDTRYVDYLLKLNASPKLIDILHHPNVEVRENAVWALANIAGDSTGHRDVLIKDNIAKGINACMSNYAPDDALTTHVMWLIANLCREKPYPEYYEMTTLLPLIQSVLQDSNEIETLHHSLSVLLSLSDTDEIGQIEDILGMEALEKIFELLKSENLPLKNLALRVIGHFLTGDDSQVQYLITRGVIQAVTPLLMDKKKKIKKDAVWVLSNICAGNYNIIEQLISYKDGYVIKTLFSMANQEEYEVAQECIFGLANICSGGDFKQMQMLVEEGLIEIIINALKKYQDPDVIKICLQALENLLDEAKTVYELADPSQNPYMVKLEQCNGFTVIQDFQMHKDEEVYAIVNRVIENHFDYE